MDYGLPQFLVLFHIERTWFGWAAHMCIVSANVALLVNGAPAMAVVNAGYEAGIDD